MNSSTNRKILMVASMVAGLMTISTAANAIPAFARKYKAECTACHTAYPKLNETGRHFKEAGYSMGGEQDMVGEEKISDYLHWDKFMPLSGVIVLRPYDRESPGGAQNRALHEVEIMSGGRAYKNVSTWFEMEAEDNEDAFNLFISSAFVTYQHSKAVNLQAGYGHYLFADSYDTYSDMRRLTASHNPITNLRFLEADNGGRFRDPRQQVSLFGRVLDDKLFYIAGYGGLAGDTVGDRSQIYYGRLAFDIMPDLMIGGMVMNGSCEVGTESFNKGAAACGVSGARDRDFSRVALDAQADVDNVRVVGVYMNVTEDLDAASGDETNAAWYLEGSYVLQKDGRPTWVPMLRVDGFEENDGKDSFTTATANIGYYFTQNIKGFLEYSNTYDAPTSDDEGSRSTVQLEAAF